MADLAPVTEPTTADIAEWYKIQDQLAKLKATESMLRSRLAKHFFPNPTEGSKENKHPLNDGTGAILQMDHKVNRKVLSPELDVLKAKIDAEGSNLPKLPFSKLVKYTPELVKAEYNKLTAEERKLFDEALEIKDGMPDLKVVIPARGS